MAFSAQRALMARLAKIIFERGYLFGGLKRDPTDTVANKTGWNFVTETSFDPANGEMPAIRRDQGQQSLCGDIACYPHSGRTASFGYLNEIQKMIWETEADSTLSAVMTQAKAGSSGVAAHIEQKGYMFGGVVSGTEQNTIDGLNFINETQINPSVTIGDTNRSWGCGWMSDTKGYHAGGLNGSTEQDDISAFIFSTETASNPSATLGSPKDQLGGFSSSTRGYAGGSGGQTRRCDSFLFSTETNTDLGVTFLALAQEDGVGIASSTRGYWCAGTHGGGAIANIKRDVQAVNFSNDTFNDPSNLVQAPGTMRGTSGQQWTQS